MWHCRLNWRPILDLMIRLPYISIQTSLCNRVEECMVLEYIMLDIHVWKWRCAFRLYDTDEKRHRRECAARKIEREKDQ